MVVSERRAISKFFRNLLIFSIFILSQKENLTAGWIDAETLRT